MTPPRQSDSSISLDPVGQVVAWRRDVPDYHVDKVSKQHVLYVGGADYAMCGARVRWMHITPGDGRRCNRCFVAAAKARLVNEYGDPIQ